MQGQTFHQRTQAFELKCFFLTCAVAVGVYGGVTFTLALLLLQGAPAFVALVVVIVGGPGTEGDGTHHGDATHHG